MTNGNQLTREEQAWLVEYQVCQQDANSTSSNYWTLAGIFIGVSSVLLAGIIYGVLANDNGFNAIDCTLRTLVTIFGVAIITILVFLWFWLKRVNYLTDRNYERMREIELDLGMWKSWRVHSIDTWKDLGFKSSDTLDDKKIDEMWNSMKGKLKERLPEKYFRRLREKKGTCSVLQSLQSFSPTTLVRRTKQKFALYSDTKHFHRTVVFSHLKRLASFNTFNISNNSFPYIYTYSYLYPQESVKE